MKKIVFILLLSLFLFGCRNDSEQEKKKFSIEEGQKLIDEANETIKKSKEIDGFEKAEYEKYNSYASENGLDGKEIYVEGKIISKTALEECISFNIEQEDGNRWCVAAPVSDDVDELIDSLTDHDVRIFGVYIGFSDRFNCPSIALAVENFDKAEKVRIEKKINENSYKTVWNFLDYANQSEENDLSEIIEDITIGQINALRSAKQYLEVSPFSYYGLVEQLEYEGYSNEDAVYAANNCGADWNEQAAKSAEIYLDIMVFSKNELIEQLQYEGFTYDQAVYGATQNGY